MTLQTRYITLDDFKNYFQVDLTEKFESEVSALGFLKRIENRLETFINTYFYKNINREYSRFNDYQKEHYKLALLEQAMYVFRNGDISVDSGYSPEEGVRADKKTIVNLIIAENAKQELILCGLWNRHIGATGIFNFWW